MRSAKRLHCLTASYRGAEPLQAGAPPAAVPVNVRHTAPGPAAPGTCRMWLSACYFTVVASLARGNAPVFLLLEYGSTCKRWFPARGSRQRIQRVTAARARQEPLDGGCR